MTGQSPGGWDILTQTLPVQRIEVTECKRPQTRGSLAGTELCPQHHSASGLSESSPRLPLRPSFAHLLQTLAHPRSL